MKNDFKMRFAKLLIFKIVFSLVIGLLAFALMLRQSENAKLAFLSGISGFLLAAAAVRIPSLLAPGWDGTVTGKTVRYRTIQNNNNVPEYELTVTDHRGREHRDVYLDEADDGSPNRVEYYCSGDRVRKHRGFKYYEKFDKTGNNYTVCINCGKLNYKSQQYCVKCGLFLLFENIGG